MKEKTVQQEHTHLDLKSNESESTDPLTDGLDEDSPSTDLEEDNDDVEGEKKKHSSAFSGLYDLLPITYRQADILAKVLVGLAAIAVIVAVIISPAHST